MVSNVRIVDSEGLFAASLSTWVSFGAAVDTNTSTAHWWVNKVELLILVVKDLEGRNTEIAGLLHGSQFVAVAVERSFLVAAALATTRTASKWTFDSDNFLVGIEFPDNHFIVVTRATAPTAEDTGVLERFKDLVFADKVLELGLGIAATQKFLETTASRLT